MHDRLIALKSSDRDVYTSQTGVESCFVLSNSMLTEVEAVLPDINCQNSRDSTSRRIAPASASFYTIIDIYSSISRPQKIVQTRSPLHVRVHVH